MKKGLLIGAIIGGITAGVTSLLIAPKTGKEMRGQIQEKYQEIKVKAEAKIAELKAAKIESIEEEAAAEETAATLVENNQESTEKTA